MRTAIIPALLVMLSGAALDAAEQFRLLVMQAQKGDAAKYAPLAEYLADKGVPATVEGASGYGAAAAKFAKGEAEAMVAGSAVAGILIIKDLAEPVARPESAAGVSTYKAVILAKKGAAPYDGKASYFAGKTVTCCALASSGELFLKSALAGSDVKVEPAVAKSHGAAIEALARDQAQLAIVKNMVWAKEQAKQPDLVQVGEDDGVNPDNTLIVAKHVDAATRTKVTEVLLGLEKDQSPEAMKVKESLGCARYIPTTKETFAHNLTMLGKAGISKDFAFQN
jgi:ABC-type phosphate/phosphonate transport system substrate-binding protein